MASRNPARPLSPHLQIWRWGPHMLVSILHRVTGSGMATVGSLLLVWWLAALAGGAESYATFQGVFTTDSGALNVFGVIIGVGLTLSLFQHMMSGIRHLFLDTGAGFELKTNKTFAMLTMVASVTLTAVFWLYLGMK
ncbi:succinate dehydrogenase / fumarate reductase cytochrome b subunit [Sphingomonas abaci]|uniref:Succinate dehydrogenase cytochrome b556 subunit n=2 Tax=Sphingomonas abaci TaxID=237611 RepID=A0A7W7AG24_9SPHN|nr:succinate dehydrogenase, cytochrome b556 subunit [Sphingomonas abaci]MBB4616388.1 succinate dehydrogenase / fumarate reductase cytochrome b subunit [Sphingomonas abaci]